ncbi:helix-turn-helix domain-containing protein [Fodinicola feengrottensis]|uniref:helix-turn-helix domain-containing protein n=1 Tax=Fodinicola feengrottensis TaxID=435914 RepID=UPI0024436F61|nr:helix-turn-helix domain-containing protein [Fodinicola feengrottensis]
MQDQIPAVRRALEVLRLLAARPGPLPASAIARELGLPRSSAYHLLSVLADQGFVIHLPEERRYALGGRPSRSARPTCVRPRWSGSAGRC